MQQIENQVGNGMQTNNGSSGTHILKWATQGAPAGTFAVANLLDSEAFLHFYLWGCRFDGASLLLEMNNVPAGRLLRGARRQEYGILLYC